MCGVRVSQSVNVCVCVCVCVSVTVYVCVVSVCAHCKLYIFTPAVLFVVVIVYFDGMHP